MRIRLTELRQLAFHFCARARKETKGQDLIEYALMAGFVAVTAGAIMPNIMTDISTIFSKVLSIMTAAGTQPS